MLRAIVADVPMFRVGRIVWTIIATGVVAGHARATPPVAPPTTKAQNDFFESRIRPVLVEKCGKCHAANLPSPKGGLVLDTKAGLRKGGRDGVILVPGKPSESRLLAAIRYSDPDIEMPPSGKLPDAVVADFERWISSGAYDPRPDTPDGTAGLKSKPGMSVRDGLSWWAFQPFRTSALPPASGSSTAKNWPKTRIDSFVKAAMHDKGLSPSPPTDRRTLITRAYVDLLGYKPTYAEVQAFVQETGAGSYDALIERLLASPHYGERWGRHWMDVTRYGEDNQTAEATNPAYPFAWRHRDWIVEALNADVPFDSFVQLQLAADLMPNASRSDLRALGYLGAAPVYHKDQRLSADVIGGFATDDWDERIDAVSRGLMGLSVACARCHDHKFDPIEQQDYYGLMGVFASTARAERPLFDVPPHVETRYLAMQRRLLDLRYSLNMLTNETSTFLDVPGKKARWTAEVERLRTEADVLLAPFPVLLDSLKQYFTAPVKSPKPDRPLSVGSTAPFADAVFEAATYLDASDPTYTFLVYRPGEARDMPLLRGGNYAAPGKPVPRHFPDVLARDGGRFTQGSGRRELAQRLFTDAAPLVARVIVNRIWGWHFGKAIVASTSDFGTQGDRPTHPALLDDLAARFIENGWSLKWLHREVMRSATYQQSSRPRANLNAADPDNTWLARMNSARLDIESYRDSLLRVASVLDPTMGGVSGDLEGATFFRRSIYGRISRNRPSPLLALFDFPTAVQTSPGRDQTLTNLQQIYMMNNPFIRDLSGRIAAAVKQEVGQAHKVRGLFRQVLSRDPTTGERSSALQYLKTGSLDRYARILLCTNEMVFQP